MPFTTRSRRAQNFANGYWNGTNGITSSYAENFPTTTMGIGWLDNSAGFYTTWWGTPVNTSQSIIVATWYGDANLDGIVNSDDYGFWSNTISSNPQTYLYGGTKPQWVDGDFFYEGQVGMDDYWQMDATMTTPGSNYNLGFYPQLSPNGFAQSADGSPAPQNLSVGDWPVPEPASAALLLLATVFWALCRAVRGRRSRVVACICFVIASAGGQALAQHGGTIDLGGAGNYVSALIVTTSSFGFVPSGGQPDDYGTPGVPEYGDNAIHDALVEGANFANGGYWNGTNGIISSSAQNGFGGNANLVGLVSVGWVDNSIFAYTSFDGVAVNTSQSIIATTWLGDALLEGQANSDGYQQWANSIANPGAYIYGGTKPEWIDGDFNYDGRVDSDDYGLWSNTMTTPGANYNLGFDPNGPVIPAADASESPNSQYILISNPPVPEPASLALLMSAAACMAVFCVGHGARSGWHVPELAKSVAGKGNHALRWKLREVPPMQRYCAILLALCLTALWPRRPRPLQPSISTRSWTPARRATPRTPPTTATPTR